MENLLLFVPLIVVIAVVVYVIWSRNKRKEELRKRNTILSVYTDKMEKTPKGVTVASRDGVSDAMKNIIDQSLDDVFEDAQKYAQSRGMTYTNKMTHSEYTIYVLPDCVPSPEQKVPSFRLRADDYDGTVFDQDPTPGVGYILASEYVIPNHSGGTAGFVICNSLEYAYNSVRYGAEHTIYEFNDSSEYERTKFHGNGISHPIIPMD